MKASRTAPAVLATIDALTCSPNHVGPSGVARLVADGLLSVGPSLGCSVHRVPRLRRRLKPDLIAATGSTQVDDVNFHLGLPRRRHQRTTALTVNIVDSSACPPPRQIQW